MKTTPPTHPPEDHRAPDPHGALRTPVYDNVAFAFNTAEEMNLAFEGKKPAHSYSRISNPTVEDFEERVRAMAGAASVIAVSSGMAAITNVILALAGAGGHIVASRYLFGNTRSLFEHTLKPWGLAVTYVDASDPSAVEQAIQKETRAVFIEVITNPQLQVPDVRALAEIAGARGIPLIVDGTVTSLSLFSSRACGAAVEVISTTKSISGGATCVGGVVIDNGTFNWAKHPKTKPWADDAGPMALQVYLRREIHRNLGACLAPHNAYLQTLGLETLTLRMERSSQNALTLAQRLERHARVTAVNYPGLESSLSHAAAAKQFRGGFGGLVCVEFAGRDACFRFINGLRAVRRATNINDNKTLAIHPASTIFCEYPPEARREMGVPDTLVRLSIGIEPVDAIWSDIAQALDAA